MTTILLVCGAGASSTFLASRMRALAKARFIDVTIQASSNDDLDTRLPFIDILLVGAHLAGDYEVLSARAADHGVASALLPATVFGPGGTEAALDLAATLAPIGQLASTTPTKDTPHG